MKLVRPFPLIEPSVPPVWTDFMAWTVQDSDSWFEGVTQQPLKDEWTEMLTIPPDFLTEPQDVRPLETSGLAIRALEEILSESVLPAGGRHLGPLVNLHQDKEGKKLQHILENMGIDAIISCRHWNPDKEDFPCEEEKCSSDILLRQFDVEDHSLVYWFEGSDESLAYPVVSGIEGGGRDVIIFRPVLVANRGFSDRRLEAMSKRIQLPSLLTRLFGFSENAFGRDWSTSLFRPGKKQDGTRRKTNPMPFWWIQEPSAITIATFDDTEQSTSFWREPVSSVVVMGYRMPFRDLSAHPEIVHRVRSVLDFAARVINDGVDTPLRGMVSSFHAQVGSEFVLVDRNAPFPNGRQLWTSLEDGVARSFHFNSVAQDIFERPDIPTRLTIPAMEKSIEYGFGAFYPQLLFILVRDVLLPNEDWDRARELLSFEVPGGASYLGDFRGDLTKSVEVAVLELLKEIVECRWQMTNDPSSCQYNVEAAIDNVKCSLRWDDDPWTDEQMEEAESLDPWCGIDYVESLIEEADAFYYVMESIMYGDEKANDEEIQRFLRSFPGTLFSRVIRNHFNLRGDEFSVLGSQSVRSDFSELSNESVCAYCGKRSRGRDPLCRGCRYHQGDLPLSSI